jgi:predicted AAA+ superfamily ATPase
MHRDLYAELIQWKERERRKPLLLRGARQVGKSWVVRELGRQFDHFIELNFETKKQYKEIFSMGLDVPAILERIRFFTGIPILPGKTLLFFDEIQACEPALESLRYFKENMPELHVVAAGSLLDFALEKTGLPVGRLQFLYLHPLSFAEFLTATGRTDLREYIALNNIDPIIHNKLLEEVKTYMWLGGMPEAVQTWIDTRNMNECLEVLDEITLSYKQDIPKYTKQHQIEYVENLFDAIPQQLGRKFVFKHIDAEIRSYILKNALACLAKAGIIHIVYHASAHGLPLGAEVNLRRYKVYSFDIGIVQRLLGFDPKKWLTTPMSLKHLGSIAEQFVAQEYIAYTAIKKPAELFYWHREEKKSNAEVDFLFVKEANIIPVEVKSGSKGQLKSLQLFLQTHPKIPAGLKISEAPYHKDNSLITLPFYMLEAWIKKS